MCFNGEAWAFSCLPILWASLGVSGQQKEHGCENHTTVQMPTLLPNSCVALGKSLSLSEPQLSHL